jgi:tetratricopeptide (TPR) repeat protein
MDKSLELAKKEFLRRSYRKALRLYEEVLTNSPSSALAYEGAARCLFMLRKNDEAFDRSQQALQLNEQLVLPHIVKAYIHLQRKENLKGMAEANAAIQKDSNSADVLECYGTVLMQDGNSGDAIQVLENAVAINPKSMIAHRNLVYLYSKKKDQKKWLYHAKSVFLIRPSLIAASQLILVYFANHSTITTLFLWLIIGVAYIFNLKLLTLFPLIFVSLVILNSLAMVKERNWPAVVRSLILVFIFGIPAFLTIVK